MKNYDFLKEILPYPTWYSSTQSTRRQTDPISIFFHMFKLNFTPLKAAYAILAAKKSITECPISTIDF